MRRRERPGDAERHGHRVDDEAAHNEAVVGVVELLQSRKTLEENAEPALPQQPLLHQIDCSHDGSDTEHAEPQHR